MIEGLKILDFSRYLPGPFASFRLAEMGAEVLKVETKPHGDPARSMEPFLEETGALYLACNAGKQSLALNLTDEEDLRVIHQLFQQVDVVIESYRPGVADKIGIGYQQAKEHNPQIIYCSLSGYGQISSLRDKGGHDINYLALSGVLDGLHPSVPDITIADLAGGMAAAEAILAAYIRRFKTGEGAYLDISLVDALFGWQGVNAMMSQAANVQTSLGEKLREVVSYQVYETKDGRHMALGALEEKFWLHFCKAVGREEWIPFHRSPARSGEFVYEEVKALFRSYDFSYWYEIAEQIDACLTPVLTREEALKSNLVKDRGILGTAQFQNHTVSAVHATSASGEAIERERRIPEFGEHRDLSRS